MDRQFDIPDALLLAKDHVEMLSDILLRDGPFQFSAHHRLALELEVFLRNLIEDPDPMARIDENGRFFPVP
jgi:hypothetical protein